MTNSSVGNSQEIWKPVVGYDGLYEISNHGRCRCLGVTYVGRNQFGSEFDVTKSGQALKPVQHHSGYMMFGLSKDGRRRSVTIHRLVAAAFLDPPPSEKTPSGYKWQINHKNGVKSDNHVSNLEWCTPAENIRHAEENGLRPHGLGENSPNPTLSRRDVIEIRQRRREGDTLAKLAKDYGVSDGNISMICLRKTWSHV